jgi:hypothetical protein
MGEGLQRFAEGLVMALQEKAKRNDRDMGVHMSHEADEITILRGFLEERLKKADVNHDQPIEAGFLGLVYICHYLMADPVKLASDPKQLAPEIYGNVEKLVEFLKCFEDAFESGPNKSSAVAKTRHAWETSIRDGVKSGATSRTSIGAGNIHRRSV